MNSIGADGAKFLGECLSQLKSITNLTLDLGYFHKINKTMKKQHKNIQDYDYL